MFPGEKKTYKKTRKKYGNKLLLKLFVILANSLIHDGNLRVPESDLVDDKVKQLGRRGGGVEFNSVELPVHKVEPRYKKKYMY